MTPVPAVCSPQVFHFPLSEEEATALPPMCKDPESSMKLLVGVYHRNISEEMTASVSLALCDIKTTVSVEQHLSIGVVTFCF